MLMPEYNCKGAAKNKLSDYVCTSIKSSKQHMCSYVKESKYKFYIGTPGDEEKLPCNEVLSGDQPCENGVVIQC